MEDELARTGLVDNEVQSVRDDQKVLSQIEPEVNFAPCPQCGESMFAVRGSKSAICANCGFKDSCCY